MIAVSTHIFQQVFAVRRKSRSLSLCALVVLLSACGGAQKKVEGQGNSGPSWSVSRVVNTNHSMITLLDPSDLVHHQAEPSNWFLHDFAIKDDLQTGRFAAVLTERSGKFNVRVTFGELTKSEQAVAGPEAKLRLRVINHRLLLSGGDAWPSVKTDYRRYAHDPRWIDVPNGDYGVIITALKPGAVKADYVFQLIRVDAMPRVKHAPGVPQLIYGEKAAVVGVNAKGFQFNEQCHDVPNKATWAPLAERSMPIPGARQAVELPREIHERAIVQQQSGSNATIPMVLSRNPEVGSYGFFLKPSSWNQSQVQANGDVHVSTLIRCAVKITAIDASPNNFALQLKPIPTANDRLPSTMKKRLMRSFNEWLREKNDPAWRFKEAKVERSTSDAAMILGIVDYLQLSSKESEKMLPMSNALRVEYLLDRLEH